MSSVVPPIATRVTVVAPVVVVPRFLTAAVKVTRVPAAGFGGVAVRPRICRSGPGASATTRGDGAV